MTLVEFLPDLDLNLIFEQKEPEGVMTVKFRDPISAQACVLVSNYVISLSIFDSLP